VSDFDLEVLPEAEAEGREAIQWYFDDPDHSEEEDRFVLLGLSGSLRVLVVCHCYREAGNVIRIISARKATARESKFY
jgi:uncharacterized DUF497 family protein